MIGKGRSSKLYVLIWRLGTEIKKASESENIEYTIDYKAVAKKVKATVQEGEFFLIETLAEENNQNDI